jgi:hypothetical protein
MKIALSLLLASVTMVFAEPQIQISLQLNKEGERDHSGQLIQKFNALLESNEDLKSQFAEFEKAPKERAGGRYSGYTTAPLLLHKYEDVDFGTDKGRRSYTQKLVLYYSFPEGFHRGSMVTTGVFAAFSVTGEELFGNEKENHKFVTHTVKAKFEGFRKTINADQKDADQATSSPESKPENNEKPKPEPKALPLPPAAWTRDIQRFDDELGALVSKAKVPSAETLDDSDETEAITDGYGGFVDFDASKGTLQYLANEKVKGRKVEWEFELQRDADAEKSFGGDEIAFFPKIGKKQVIDGKEMMLGHLNAILLSGAKVGPFKAGDRIRLKAEIDDFSRFKKDFDLATGLVAIYHLEGAPHPIFWLKLAKAEIIQLPKTVPAKK